MELSKYTFRTYVCGDCCDWRCLYIYKDGIKINEIDCSEYELKYILEFKQEIIDYFIKIGIYEKVLKKDSGIFDDYFSILDFVGMEIEV